MAERNRLKAEIKAARARIEACRGERDVCSLDEAVARVERELADGNWHRAQREMVATFQRVAPDLERASWLLLQHHRQAVTAGGEPACWATTQRYALLGLGATAAQAAGANPDRWLAALADIQRHADAAADRLIPVPHFLLPGERTNV